MTATLVTTTFAATGTRRKLRRSLWVVLALAALLASVLAMHSAARSHVMGFALPVATSQAESAGLQHEQLSAQPANPATVAMGVPMAMATTVAAAAVTMSQDGMLNCALMVMGCVMLLVLAVTVLLSRRAALGQRLEQAIDVGRATLFAVNLPIHQPRLTVLCINRV